MKQGRKTGQEAEGMKKIAVITGASSGMGREMAFQLADRFEVLEEIWLIARRKERLEELRGQFPANIRCFALDITDEVERKQLEAALQNDLREMLEELDLTVMRGRRSDILGLTARAELAGITAEKSALSHTVYTPRIVLRDPCGRLA